MKIRWVRWVVAVLLALVAGCTGSSGSGPASSSPTPSRSPSALLPAPSPTPSSSSAAPTPSRAPGPIVSRAVGSGSSGATATGSPGTGSGSGIETAADCNFITPDPSAPPAAADPQHAAALTAVAAEVAAIPHYPGARRVDRAPSRDLVTPPSVVGSPDQVCADEWLVSPASATAVMAWYVAHVHASAWESAGNGSAPTAVEVGDVWILAVPVGSQVGIGLLGARTWLRTRPPYTDLSGFSGSLQVDLIRPNNPALSPVNRTVTGAVVTQVVAALDALPSSPGGARSCPMDNGDKDTLQFRTGTTVVATVVVDVTGCSVVTVTVANHPTFALTGAATVNALLVRLLHLPPAYANR